MEGTFSHHVRDVIALSRQEAIRLGNDHIGTGHLLLGLIRMGHGAAIEILQTLGCDLEALQEATDDKLADMGSGRSTENVPMTRPAERVLKATYLEASLYRSTVVSTEHLLLSMLRNEEDLSATLLRDTCGITYADVRQYLSKEEAGPIPPLPVEDDPVRTAFKSMISEVFSQQPRTSISTSPPGEPGMVPVSIAALNADASGATYRLVLEEKGGSRRMSLPLGETEAQAIATELEGLRATPPRIHDLFAAVLDGFAISITAVRLSLSAEGTYRCVLLATSGETTIPEAARPADAIALALRTEASIFAHESLFDRPNA